MTNTTGEIHAATDISIRRGGWALRFAGMLLFATGCCAGSLAMLPAPAQAQATPHSAVSTFCAKISVSKISSIVGATVSLSQTAVKSSQLECIYFGKVPASVSHPIDEVVISMQAGIPPSEVPKTLAAAEARVPAPSVKGVKLKFTSLPPVGSTAFSWTYSQAVNGGQLVGIADNKGTTGYGAVVGGAAKTFGSAAGHVPVLERLLALDIAA